MPSRNSYSGLHCRKPHPKPRRTLEPRHTLEPRCSPSLIISSLCVDQSLPLPADGRRKGGCEAKWQQKHGALQYIPFTLLYPCFSQNKQCAYAALFYSVTIKKNLFLFIENLLYSTPCIGIFQILPSVSFNKDEGDLIFESNLAHSPPPGTAFKPVLPVI